MGYHELHNERANVETMPWKEFTELAYWHDSLTENPLKYETISDEEFHQIEVKAAYTQYIMMKYLAENLAKLKKKRNLVLSQQRK